jgi:hypothetical protein
VIDRFVKPSLQRIGDLAMSPESESCTAAKNVSIQLPPRRFDSPRQANR